MKIMNVFSSISQLNLRKTNFLFLESNDDVFIRVSKASSASIIFNLEL